MIISEFRKTVSKAQDRFAKEQQTTAENIQLALGLNQDGTVKYRLLNNYQPVRLLTINEVLGVKIDLLGKSGMVEGFLQKVLPKVAERKEIDPLQMNILCIKKADALHLFLMDGSTHKGKVELEELISAEELMP